MGPDSPCVLHVALTDIRPENVAHAVQNIPVDDIKDNAWKAGQAAAATARACARRPYASANPLQTTSAARLPCSLTSTPKWSRAWPARSSRRSSSLHPQRRRVRVRRRRRGCVHCPRVRSGCRIDLPCAGTMAAGIQSGIGNIAAGSAFAVAQSVGAAGLSAGGVFAASAIGGGAAFAATAAAKEAQKASR